MKCRLCLTDNAVSTKSHYISKFLRDDLFENGQSLLINKDFTRRKINDIPKDSFIFCNNCEQKFSLVETVSSKILENIDKKSNYNNLYQIKFENGNHLVELNRHQTIFNLFIISLFWRASIAKDKLFEKFHFPDDFENHVRQVLHQHLKSSKSEYDINIDFNIGFKYVFIKPEVRNSYSRGHMSACSVSKSLHMLFLVNFYICAYLDHENQNKFIDQYCNSNLYNCTLALSDVPRWKALNKITLDKIFNRA